MHHSSLFIIQVLAQSAGSDQWGWLVAAVIVLGGLFSFGAHDLHRFSLKRAWAISGVCFDESIRRRVLWITPLAIILIIVVSQLQKPIDEQDALRQTVKICLFATGTVVVMVSIILACTNLPREIETRVIYTIVTKPTTRLEIVLGKVIGFARVTLAVLLIMGIFTWGYLRISEHQRVADVKLRINEGETSETERQRLNHYLASGMLTSRTLARPEPLQVYGRVPDLQTSTRTICDSAQQEALVRFVAPRSTLFGDMPPSGSIDEWTNQGIGQLGLMLRITMNTKRTGPPNDQPTAEVQGMLGPMLPTPKTTPGKPVEKKYAPPLAQVDFVAASGGRSFIEATQLIAAPTLTDLQDSVQAFLKLGKIQTGTSAAGFRLSELTKLRDGTTGQFAYVWVPPQNAKLFFNLEDFYVRVTGFSANVDYLIGPDVARVFVPRVVNGHLEVEPPGAVEVPRAFGADGKPYPIQFHGRLGIHDDQEIRGTESGPQGVGVYSFAGAAVHPDAQGNIPFELNVMVDRMGAEVEEGREDATTLDVGVFDQRTGQTSHQDVQLENRQTTFFTVPVSAITSGDFDVTIACKSNGHIVGLLATTSLQLVTGRQSFEATLGQSLLILWMMSILVLSLAILCSTFLSWPIAIVLTIVLLLGRWGTMQLADVGGAGLGRQIVNDFKFSDAPVAEVVSTSVDALSRGMNYLSRVLPDTSAFDAISGIEQGVTPSSDDLGESLKVLAIFALPAMVLAYTIFRFKEVAP